MISKVHNADASTYTGSIPLTSEPNSHIPTLNLPDKAISRHAHGKYPVLQTTVPSFPRPADTQARSQKARYHGLPSKVTGITNSGICKHAPHLRGVYLREICLRSIRSGVLRCLGYRLAVERVCNFLNMGFEYLDFLQKGGYRQIEDGKFDHRGNIWGNPTIRTFLQTKKKPLIPCIQRAKSLLL